MMRLLKNSLGITPIIATVMLTLIAVVAATTFAIFVSQQQEEYQQSEWKATLAELENLEITAINKFNYSDNTTIDGINITVTSRHTRDSEFMVYINNKPVSGQKGYIFNISSYDTKYINLTQNIKIENNSYIKTRIVTQKWANSFEKTFLPPTAIIKIDVESLPGGTGNFYILDGSDSEPQGDGYLVKWEWNITNKTSNDYLELFGKKAQITDSSFIAQNYIYQLNLTVTDNYGMKGKTSFLYDLT